MLNASEWHGGGMARTSQHAFSFRILSLGTLLLPGKSRFLVISLCSTPRNDMGVAWRGPPSMPFHSAFFRWEIWYSAGKAGSSLFRHAQRLGM